MKKISFTCTERFSGLSVDEISDRLERQRAEEKKERKIHWILYYGNQRKKEKSHGILHGEKEDQDGILSVLRCLRNISEIPLIFMQVERI